MNHPSFQEMFSFFLPNPSSHNFPACDEGWKGSRVVKVKAGSILILAWIERGALGIWFTVLLLGFVTLAQSSDLISPIISHSALLSGASCWDPDKMHSDYHIGLQELFLLLKHIKTINYFFKLLKFILLFCPENEGRLKANSNRLLQDMWHVLHLSMDIDRSC